MVSRLKSVGPDAVARLGGDSFALLLPGMTSEKVMGFCGTVCQWLAFPYQLAGGHQAIVAAAAGASTSLLSGRAPNLLLSHADMALSAAKQRAAGIALFSPDMDDRLKDRQAMDLPPCARRWRGASSPSPSSRRSTSPTAASSAPRRWRAGPTRCSAASRRGASSRPRRKPASIVELGRWALNAACAEATAWPETLRISVNVSPVQFELSDVVADVTGALERSGIDPRRLELEMTEGIFVRDLDAVTARLDELRKLGVSVALDDFGTGYSSLQLSGAAAGGQDQDRPEFCERLPADTEAAAIISAVVALSGSLGKQIIAEGVENRRPGLDAAADRLQHGARFSFRPAGSGRGVRPRRSPPRPRPWPSPPEACPPRPANC